AYRDHAQAHPGRGIRDRLRLLHQPDAARRRGPVPARDRRAALESRFLALSIVHFASEAIPLAKVGGLADMVGTLAAEQARRGHRVVVALPAYRDRKVPKDWTSGALGDAQVPWGMGKEPATFELLQSPDGEGPRILLVDHAGARRFFDRPGIYDAPETRQGYADNAERFLFFSRAALAGFERLGERAD